MNIFKAFLLFALLIGLEGLMSLGFLEFIELSVSDSLSSDNRTHYYRITSRIAKIISYLVIFFFFFKTAFDWKKGIEKVKIIDDHRSFADAGPICISLVEYHSRSPTISNPIGDEHTHKQVYRCT